MPIIGRWLASTVLAIALVTCPLVVSQQAFADGCDQPPDDQTRTTTQGTLDNCGSPTWEMVVNFGGQQWDEGQANGDGVCVGNYINCNCDGVPQSFDEASIEFYYEEESDPEEPDVYTYDWWWDVTNWNSPPTFHACSSGFCSSTAIVR